MPTPHIIAAIGTPLDTEENLHRVGLDRQLQRIALAGTPGILVAGTMGMMPLLTDATYAELVREACALGRNRFEVLVGVSDLSLARTRARIELANAHPNDGVVVLPPYFIRFQQSELIDYFSALADCSRTPLFLYDLPQRTFAPIDPGTVLALASHPNVAGIKCSGELEQSLALRETLADAQPDFRVIIAKPKCMQSLISRGVHEHLDGVYTLAPRWTMAVAAGASIEGHNTQESQAALCALLDVIQHYGSLPSLTHLMNACGVPGCFAPRPFADLVGDQLSTLLEEPVVQKLLQSDTIPA